MTTITRKFLGYGKWVVALIVFVLCMTITFDAAYGLPLPPSHRHNRGRGHGDTRTNQYNHNRGGFKFEKDFNRPGRPGDNDCGQKPDDSQPDVTAVPEPSTLLLLAGGLGVLRAATRKKKA